MVIKFIGISIVVSIALLMSAFWMVLSVFITGIWKVLLSMWPKNFNYSYDWVSKCSSEITVVAFIFKVETIYCLILSVIKTRLLTTGNIIPINCIIIIIILIFVDVKFVEKYSISCFIEEHFNTLLN